jgi:hypothetical protein
MGFKLFLFRFAATRIVTMFVAKATLTFLGGALFYLGSIEPFAGQRGVHTVPRSVLDVTTGKFALGSTFHIRPVFRAGALIVPESAAPATMNSSFVHGLSLPFPPVLYHSEGRAQVFSAIKYKSLQIFTIFLNIFFKYRVLVF